MPAENQTIPPIIHALLDPSRYPHTCEDIRLIETHISWLLLAGNTTYKIKKPLDLGFLDFSTLEKRHHACNEELRLNTRLASKIYQAVLPITGTESDPAINGTGQIIEYCVSMYCFDPDKQLDVLQLQNKLDNIKLDVLAKIIANFHLNLEASDVTKHYGNDSAILTPALENLDSLLSLQTEATHRSPLQRLREWTEKTFEQHRSLFNKRKSSGFIRECHGDLHLGNIVMFQGQPLIFDCLEFNPDLRWIDVLNDIAFLIMDLQKRSMNRQSYRLLNNYLEYTGDYTGLPIMRFYQCYRALVRAKIANIRLQQTNIEEHGPIKSERDEYLLLAESYMVQTPVCLILNYGLSGSGKSKHSAALLEHKGAIRLRSDVERKRLHQLQSHEQSNSLLEQGLYSKQASEQTYKHLSELSRTILCAGFSVIVDATFLKSSQRKIFQELAGELDIKFVILDYQAPADELRSRINNRLQKGTDASEANVEVLEHQLLNREPLDDSEKQFSIIVDTTKDFQDDYCWRLLKEHQMESA